MATKKKKKVEPVVYVGPTLPNGLLARFTVFRDGNFLPHIQELREKSPALRGLFVPISQLSEARINVGVKGHILNLYAKKVLEEVKQ